MQPYAIELLLASGIPLLWEGQELGESYVVPYTGFARIGRLRPVAGTRPATALAQRR